MREHGAWMVESITWTGLGGQASGDLHPCNKRYCAKYFVHSVGFIQAGAFVPLLLEDYQQCSNAEYLFPCVQNSILFP